MGTLRPVRRLKASPAKLGLAGRRADASGGAPASCHHFPGLEAARADVDAPGNPVQQNLFLLDVGLEGPTGPAVRVADPHPEARSLATDFAHSRHLLSPDESARSARLPAKSRRACSCCASARLTRACVLAALPALVVQGGRPAPPAVYQWASGSPGPAPVAARPGPVIVPCRAGARAGRNRSPFTGEGLV